MDRSVKIQIEPGTYVVAVSGGVDSVVLLDLLSKNPNLRLTVAHFDHGIRQDSVADRVFVHDLAGRYGLPFVYGEGDLGGQASEATAREARYTFLRGVQRANAARALVTAHHQDDLLETAILNMLRGTGRRGLTALQSRDDLLRPLLGVPKVALIAYARDQGLVWRDDPTNADTKYQRNYIRHEIMPHFSPADRSKLVDMLTDMQATNHEVDEALGELLASQEGAVKRQWFNRLPHSVARELMASWLRENGVSGFDRYTIERLVAAAKTAQPGKLFPVMKGTRLVVGRDTLALRHAER